MKIVILGAGGTGLEMAASVGRVSEFAGFLDDNPDKQKHGYKSFPVLGKLEDWWRLSEKWRFLSSLYAPKETFGFSLKIGALHIPDVRWATIVDSFSQIADDCEIGNGTFIGPGTVVQPNVKIGKRCFLNGTNYLSHDCRLGEYVCFANGVSLCGHVVVKDAAFLGTGTVVRHRVTIGLGAVVGMGSVVLESVKDFETVVGNPAKTI